MDAVAEATVPKPGSDPLTDSYLKAVVKELEQTAVAVSVVGTTPRKLKDMAALTVPITDALVDARPEVVKARSVLKRAAHNARTSTVKARQASAALRALAKEVGDIQKMVSKGIGKTKSLVKIAGSEVVNTWGYTDSEMRDVLRALEKAAKAVMGAGLPTAAGGLAELNPNKVQGASFVQYDAPNDLFVFDLRKAGSANVENVLRALAERLWLQEFNKGDKETWEGKKGVRGFSQAFADILTGKRVDKDTTARLQVTVGKLAANWPATA